MRRYLWGLTCLIAAGCLFPSTRNLRSISEPYEGFLPRGELRTYAAVDLSGYLPVEAAIFREYRVDSCLVAEYIRGRETYQVEVYSFREPAGALGTYLFRGMDAKGQEHAIGYRSRQTADAVESVKGYYYLKIAPLAGGTGDGALELARGLTERIPGGVIPPDLFETLPQENLLHSSQFYFAGPRTFEIWFDRDLASALDISYALDGIAVKYQLDRYQVDFLKIHYRNRNDTFSAIDSYKAVYADRPSITSNLTLMYTTVVNPDRTEDYLGESGEYLYVMRGARPNGPGQELFEYILRGGR